MSRKPSATPGGGGSGGKKAQHQVPGQSSLFSFFSKAKSPAPAAATPAARPKEEPPAPGTATTSSSSSPSPSLSQEEGHDSPQVDPTPTKENAPPPCIAPSSSPGRRDPPASTKAETKAEPMFGSNVVGRRIEVYWPDDEEYYRGKVTHFLIATGKHRIKYDDGEMEDLSLTQETYRWLDDEGSGGERKEVDQGMDSPPGAAPVPEDEDEEEEDDGVISRSSMGQSKKRRVITQDCDDESEEEELDLGEGGGASSSSSLLKRKDTATPRPPKDDRPATGGGSSGKKAR